MRLRKTLKQTAAATLALGMALSAAAPTVSAAYVCDVSQGSVNIAVDEDGNKSIQVNGEDVTDDGDGTDDIIITGDNTQAAATQNDAEETASAAEGSETRPARQRKPEMKRDPTSLLHRNSPLRRQLLPVIVRQSRPQNRKPP